MMILQNRKKSALVCTALVLLLMLVAVCDIWLSRQPLPDTPMDKAYGVETFGMTFVGEPIKMHKSTLEWLLKNCPVAPELIDSPRFSSLLNSIGSTVTLSVNDQGVLNVYHLIPDEEGLHESIEGYSGKIVTVYVEENKDGVGMSASVNC